MQKLQYLYYYMVNIHFCKLNTPETNSLWSLWAFWATFLFCDTPCISSADYRRWQDSNNRAWTDLTATLWPLFSCSTAADRYCYSANHCTTWKMLFRRHMSLYFDWRAWQTETPSTFSGYKLAAHSTSNNCRL